MIENILTKKITEILDEIYEDNIYDIQFQKTRKEFEGDITLVVFPFTRFSKKSPEITAKEIGERLIKLPEIKSFNVIKGFLNLEIEDSYWLSQFSKIVDEENFGFVKASEKTPIHLVEYSSPRKIV